MRPKLNINRQKSRVRRGPAQRKTDYVIFDFESLGLKVHTDQPTQGGFVKLDEDLMVTERLNVNIKRNQYSVPGPVALEVTDINPDDLDSDQRLTEFEAAKRVRSILGGNRGDGKRIFAGYNSLPYDEQLLRYFLFRNFQYPYVTSGVNSRKVDIYQVVKFLHAIRPGLIHPGKDHEGKDSWRLENVIVANNIELGKAHDAVADGVMTADLLREIHRLAPDVLAALVEMSNKKVTEVRISNKISKNEYLYMFTDYGKADLQPLLPVVQTSKGSVLCVDLTKDPENWVDKTPEQLLEDGGAFGKDSIFRLLRPASCPYIFDADSEMVADFASKLEMDTSEFDSRSKTLSTGEIRTKLAQLANLMDAEAQAKFLGDPVTEEETLYGGKFPDKEISGKFVAAKSWKERAAVIEDMTDPRLQNFGNRLLAMYGPEELQTKESLKALRGQIALRLKGADEVGKFVTTIEEARQQLEEVKSPDVKANCARYLDELEAKMLQDIARLDERLESGVDRDGPAQLSLF